MQHTTKYKFNLIETSDAFGPEALNANAEAAERELAALADAHAADKAELQTAMTAGDAALSQTVAALAADTAAKLGSGGKTCRVKWGSYTGNGKAGSSGKNSLTFDFKPVLLIICRDNYNSQALIMRSSLFGYGDIGKANYVQWGDQTVTWYSTSNGASSQLNESGATYFYVAIGESLE